MKKKLKKLHDFLDGNLIYHWISQLLISMWVAIMDVIKRPKSELKPCDICRTSPSCCTLNRCLAKNYERRIYVPKDCPECGKRFRVIHACEAKKD